MNDTTSISLGKINTFADMGEFCYNKEKPNDNAASSSLSSEGIYGAKSKWN